jgi:hypothetical protein
LCAAALRQQPEAARLSATHRCCWS